MGLHSVRCKALAGRLTSFMQTAANPKFQRSSFHSALYRYFCNDDDTEGVPDIPPYYPLNFLQLTKNVINHTPLNPISMSLKDWYRFLLEEEVTHQHSIIGDLPSPLEPKRTRVEEQTPLQDWPLSYELARLRCLSPELMSFNFKLQNLLLPVRERLSELQPLLLWMSGKQRCWSGHPHLATWLRQNNE